MAILNRYRTLAAALLVLLYAFVAMPVQWWHHHNVPEVSSEIFAREFSGNFNNPGQEGKAIVRVEDKIVEERAGNRNKDVETDANEAANAKKGKYSAPAFSDDCPICSHQYASHDGIAFALTLSIPDIPTQFLAEQLIVLYPLPVAFFSNRGPPALS